jgi:hypothetical protein
MTGRQKRSLALPHDLAESIDQAAASEGTTVSAWIVALKRGSVRTEGAAAPPLPASVVRRLRSDSRLDRQLPRETAGPRSRLKPDITG